MMKRKLSLILPLLLLGCLGVAAQGKGGSGTPPTDETGRFYIYWSTWIEWGHLPDCNGWGLCDYQDCWFCDVDDKLHGKIKIEIKTKSGEMIIELNPNKADEKKAIADKADLLVDSDLSSEHTFLSKGKYKFDPAAGAYGGYKLAIRMK